MTTAEQAKQAGLKSLAELSDITMMPVRTLQDWHKSNNEKFQRLCEMAAAWKLNKEFKNDQRQ